MEMVYDFAIDGRVEGMHTDKFSLAFLGQQSISRASDIVFNHATQLWDIHVLYLAPAPPIEACSGFESYEVAREFEVRWFNTARRLEVLPMSSWGRAIALGLRENM